MLHRARRIHLATCILYDCLYQFDGANNMKDTLLVSLGSSIDAHVFGSKAARLSKAFRAGLPVPTGCVLHPDLVFRIAHSAASQGERAELETSLASFTDGGVAVRSSA